MTEDQIRSAILRQPYPLVSMTAALAIIGDKTDLTKRAIISLRGAEFLDESDRDLLLKNRIKHAVATIEWMNGSP